MINYETKLYECHSWPSNIATNIHIIFREVCKKRCGMGTSQKYSLRWNDFSINVATTFRDLHSRQVSRRQWHLHLRQEQSEWEGEMRFAPGQPVVYLHSLALQHTVWRIPMCDSTPVQVCTKSNWNPVLGCTYASKQRKAYSCRNISSLFSPFYENEKTQWSMHRITLLHFLRDMQQGLIPYSCWR